MKKGKGRQSSKSVELKEVMQTRQQGEYEKAQQAELRDQPLRQEVGDNNTNQYR